MKVQIHHNELRPLIKEGYQKVYDGMRKLLAPEEMIFAEWEAGFGDILQWKLPDDYQWCNFTQGDTYDKQAVINELLRTKELALKKLGTNERLKQNVFSIPSEASIYYTVAPDGRYRVMLTAWGYSYPTKAPVTDFTWVLPPDSQDTTVRFIENGIPVANLPINLLRKEHVVHHKLDEKGEKFFGKLLPGEELKIEIPSHNRVVTLTVVQGQIVYTFDLTIAQQQVKPEIPKVPVVPDDTHKEPIKNRMVKIQFIGCDGNPIANRIVSIAKRGNIGIENATDESGCIYLTNSNLAAGNILKLHINDAPQQPKFADVEMVVEDKEDDYVIVYQEKKSSWWWLYLLLLLAAAVLAYFVIAFAVTTRL